MLSLRRIGPVVLLTVVGLAGCRQDMHDQPRYKPLAKSDFYPDMRSARLRLQLAGRVLSPASLTMSEYICPTP